MKTIHEIVSELAFRLWRESIWRHHETDALTNWTQAEALLGLYQPYVQRAAYFFWQHRQRYGISGTPEGDWHEAELQMLARSLRSSSRGLLHAA